jgi:hypothetical protein
MESAKMLASSNGRSEDVAILPIVVAELEFGNIGGRYFLLTLWNVPMQPRLRSQIASQLSGG